jgi:hypothetical protein
MEFSVHHPSPPNTYYYYVREENLGSTRKFVNIYLLFTGITKLILALHKTAEKSPAHAQQVFFVWVLDGI